MRVLVSVRACVCLFVCGPACACLCAGLRVLVSVRACVCLLVCGPACACLCAGLRVLVCVRACVCLLVCGPACARDSYKPRSDHVRRWQLVSSVDY